MGKPIKSVPFSEHCELDLHWLVVVFQYVFEFGFFDFDVGDFLFSFSSVFDELEFDDPVSDFFDLGACLFDVRLGFLCFAGGDDYWFRFGL